MLFLAVDLGSTNTKAALYDARMRCVAMQSTPVNYIRTDGLVEFDIEEYLSCVFALIRSVSASANSGERVCITLTGQAESLLLLDKNGHPLMNAISWMDERSSAECAELETAFSRDVCYAHTGQPAALPTWPATKVLWLRKNKPDLFRKVATYTLLKDYVVYRLTGRLLADCSIATFSFYFDIYERSYWHEMLVFLGVLEAQLPQLTEPCETAGMLLPEVALELGLAEETLVNNGTLDHFCGMIGTGNVTEGQLSLSTGTVLGLSTLAASQVRRDTGIPMHYGFLPEQYVMLSASESGGVSLEWYKNAFMPDVRYADIDLEAALRYPGDVLFLPYLVGSNGPEFDQDACGVFYGLRSKHDRYDLALSVMDGVCHLLRKNCDHIQKSGTRIDRILATGGGAKSALWCQMQADITGIPVYTPADKEAALLGAAMIGAVSAGVYPTYAAAAGQVVQFSNIFYPNVLEKNELRHRQFVALYDAMIHTQEIR
jgi:sugar (pentulose or hexulose) kinase